MDYCAADAVEILYLGRLEEVARADVTVCEGLRRFLVKKSLFAKYDFNVFSISNPKPK